MAVGSVVARILTQYSDKGSKAAAKDINKLGKNFDAFAKKSAKAFGIAAAAATAFAVKIGVDSVKAAIADEKSQAILANSLRNTTGATDAAIAATEEWISAVQAAYGEVDDNLRPALSKLAAMTGSVADAQALLGLALDVSAGGGVDLGAATNAVTKALQGNFKALKNLGVPITDAMVKSKDLNAVLELTSKTFAGAASTRANTFEFRMKRLGIAFEEAKETLGNALLPVIEKLYETIVTKVIPAVQEWLNENGAKLVAAFEGSIKAVVGFGFIVFKVFQFVAKNKNVFISLAAIFTATFVAAKVIAFVTAIGKLVAIYKALRAAAIGAAAAQAVATGGISVAAAVAGAAAFAATLGGLYVVIKNANGQLEKLETTGKDLEFTFDGLDGTTADFLKGLKNLNINLGRTAGTTKKLTTEQKVLLGLQMALKKLGSTPTSETDPIQLEAARLNLIKQQNLAIQAVDASYLKFIERQMMANTNAQRYADILKVIQDGKISTLEIDALATAWGIPREAVIEYITKVTGIAQTDFAGLDAPGMSAASGWISAKAALDAYFVALGLKAGGGLAFIETPNSISPNSPARSTSEINSAVAAMGGVVSAIGSNLQEYTVPSAVGTIQQPNLREFSSMYLPQATSTSTTNTAPTTNNFYITTVDPTKAGDAVVDAINSSTNIRGGFQGIGVSRAVTIL